MTIRKVKKSNKNYPKKLLHLNKPPEELYCLGQDSNGMLDNLVVGIVGSRKVSSYGRKVTKELAEYLANKDIAVISGLALGVDSIAHRAVVEAKGRTISVLPGGIEKIYPASHAGLAKNIVSNNGMLVSEYKGRTTPMKHNFIQRNRIIAALCDLLIIPEAAEKSGSLHTARFALELGKTVAAVPGDIYSPTSVGCNNLIKQGASPITTVNDVADLLGLDTQMSFSKDYYPEDNNEAVIIDLIKKGIINGSEIQEKSNIEINVFQQTMSTLEIRGIIYALGNNKWSLR